jgi:hypothetical protein
VQPRYSRRRVKPATARVPSRCATCRELGSLEVSQVIRGGKLRWVEEFSCACGHAFEAGGAGLPTKVVREALLEQVGHAELWLDDPKARPVVTKVLVRVLGVKARLVAKLLAKVPAVAFDGTHGEAQFLALALERQGLQLRLVLRPPVQAASVRPAKFPKGR